MLILPTNLSWVLQWDTSNSSRPPLKRSEFNGWFGRVFSVDRRVDLHGFSDSSKACCAVIYAQSVVAEGVKVNFLVLKIKAAPLKTLSIPRLELLGCLLLSKLINEMVDDFLGRVVVDKIFCWTDTRVALSWI